MYCSARHGQNAEFILTDEIAHTRLTVTNWGALLRPRHLSHDQLSPNHSARARGHAAVDEQRQCD